MKWGQTQSYKMQLRRAVLLAVAVAGAFAVHLGISHIPLAHAAGCTGADFVCPGNGTGPEEDGNWDEGVQLIRTDGGPTGSNDPGAPTTQPGGTTFNYTVHYHVNQPSNADADLWVIINGPANIVSYDNPSTGSWPTLGNNACAVGGGDGLSPAYCSGINLSPSCPSFYYAPSSNYYSGSEGAFYAGQPYRNGVDPDYGHEVSCYGAQTLIWPHTVNGTSVAGGTEDEHFSVQIPSTVHDARFSVRAYLSTSVLTNVYTRSAPQEFIVQPTTFSGHVNSDFTGGTGRILDGITMQVTDCGSTVYATAVTSLGSYEFPMGSASVGQSVCIGPTSATFTAGDGSQYSGFSPGGYNPSCGKANDVCPGYNFTFDPVDITPSIVKTSSAGGGSLSPGSNDTFSITITNPYDANIPDINAYDYVPVNIDPNTVTWGAAVLSQSAGSGAPPGWGWGLCQCQNPIGWGFPTLGASLPIGSSFVSGDTQYASVNSYCNDCDGNRPTVGWNFSTMPAYSQVQFTFSGRVKAANDVLPAPNPGVYCAAASEPTIGDYYGNLAGIRQVCPDPNIANDLQGVWNRGYVSMNAGAANTADTYDPIPGCNPSSCPQTCPTTGPCPTSSSAPSICIGKTYDSNDSFAGNDSAEVGEAATYLPDCGVNVLDNSDNFAGGLPNGVHYIYSDPLSNGGILDSGTFAIQAQINSPSSLGPTMFTIDDQPGFDNGGNLDPAMTETGCTNCTPSSAAPPQHLSTPAPLYDSADYANGSGPAWNFNENWANPGAHPIGANATNQAVLTVVDLATPGHPTYPYYSNTVAVKHVDVIRPGIDVNGGDVQSGAGVQVNSADQACSLPAGYNPATPNPLAGTINTNPSVGQYVVGAGGSIGSNAYGGTTIEGFASNHGLNNLTQTASGALCLPDLQSIISTFSNSMTTGSTSLQNGDDTSKGYAGKVVKAPVGDFHLAPSGPVTINQRFTLYVQGNLYIDHNVSFGAGGSMAVVVTGNIFINHGVTNVDGFYYARNGVINTCEDSPGVTLGHGLSQGDCQSPLTVNGFLLGLDLRLNRSPLNGNGETINFSPQLYLNTPPGLSNLGVNVLGTYSIESPRY